MTSSDCEKVLAGRNLRHVREVSLSKHPITERQHNSWCQISLRDCEVKVRILSIDSEDIFAYNFEALGDEDAWRWSAYPIIERLPRLTYGALMPLAGMAIGFNLIGARRLDSEVSRENFPITKLLSRIGIESRTEPGLSWHSYSIDRREGLVALERSLSLLPSALSSGLSGLIKLPNVKLQDSRTMRSSDASTIPQ